MQVTSPEVESPTRELQSSESKQKEISVSPASMDMLAKLFPNKKKTVLELVLKR